MLVLAFLRSARGSDPSPMWFEKASGLALPFEVGRSGAGELMSVMLKWASASGRGAWTIGRFGGDVGSSYDGTLVVVHAEQLISLWWVK